MSKLKKIFLSLGDQFIFVSDFILSIILFPQTLFLTIAYMMEEYYQGFPLTKLIYLIYLFIMALFIFSLSRTVMKFSKKLMEKYRALSCPRSLKTDLLFLIKEKRIFVNLGLVLLIYALLPLDWPFMALKLAFPDRTALATAIYIPILSALHLLGYLSGIKAWRNKTKDLSKKKYTASCVLLTVAYLICPTAIIAALPLIYTLFFLVPELMRIEIILPIVLLIGFIVSYRYLRAYLKRRSLLKELKKICSERQYTLSQIRDPYRSLFFDFEGESFSVTVNSKTYSCKLLSGANWTNLNTRKHPKALLADGSIIEFNFGNACITNAGWCLATQIDINGAKKPNAVGRDVFQFNFYSQTGEFFPSGIYRDDTYDKDTNTYVRRTAEELRDECNSEVKVGGWSCAARIVADSFKINY